MSGSQNSVQNNLVEFNYLISAEDREKMFGCKGSIVWFTGPPASGKSTIANELEILLFENKVPVIVLDGDCVRKGLCSDLDFSVEGRTENIRRVAEVAKLIKNNGFVVLCSFVSPLKSQRQNAREIAQDNFIECYIKTSLEQCMQRDPKGFYKKAKEKQIKNFTSVDSVYEQPDNPEIIIETEKQSPKESAEEILNFLRKKQIVSS